MDSNVIIHVRQKTSYERWDTLWFWVSIGSRFLFVVDHIPWAPTISKNKVCHRRQTKNLSLPISRYGSKLGQYIYCLKPHIVLWHQRKNIVVAQWAHACSRIFFASAGNVNTDIMLTCMDWQIPKKYEMLMYEKKKLTSRKCNDGRNPHRKTHTFVLKIYHSRIILQPSQKEKINSKISWPKTILSPQKKLRRFPAFPWTIGWR